MITLRKLTSQDLDYFWTWGSDPIVTKSLFWDAYESKTEAKKFLETAVDSHPFFKAICLDEVPIGAITLDQGKNRSSIRAELGYVLAHKYWGKGITTTAVKLAIDSGFKEISELIRIEAFVDPENLASMRVLEKAGLIKEAYLTKYLLHRGQIKDRIIYATTRN